MSETILRQSVGIISFFASLGLAAIIVWLMWQLSEPAMGTLNNSSTVPEVRQSVQWTDTLLTNMPVVFVLMAVVGGIAFVVYQTRFV